MSKQFLVYTGNDCTYCSMVKSYILNTGNTYVEKNVSEDADARAEFLAKGYRGVPVIFLDGEEFAHGYQELTKKLVKE